MFRINNNDFKILQKYKSFLMNLDNSLENIPRKDIYFKDRIKNISLDVLKDILLCSYDTSSVKIYRTSIKANIALFDFMLERLLLKKYISEKNLYKLASELVEINKMVTGWLNNNESKFVWFTSYI
ncbi:MAG: four helix bundle protein [Firmicutes bacterium]|nr:four helix bundle protein [Bacillota bacterium]